VEAEAWYAVLGSQTVLNGLDRNVCDWEKMDHPVIKLSTRRVSGLSLEKGGDPSSLLL
jgi:hypothetical protein